MSLKNILVAFNATKSAEKALEYAIFLAAQTDDAHVTGLLAYSRHETVGSRGSWIPKEASVIIDDANEQFIEQQAARFQTLSANSPLGDRLHFRQESGRIDRILSENARSYDLVVIGLPGSGAVDEHVIIHPDRIALMSGRPILIVPENYDQTRRHNHAALAWDGGRAAARALSDGLQILETLGEVSIVTIGSKQSDVQLESLLIHLARHDVKGTHEHLKRKRSVARTLLDFCVRKDPCLLIMGAYEHSKFREDFLGGVTADVMRKTKIPVLLSH